MPYAAFKKAGLEVSFATEAGKPPLGDKLLLEGLTQKLLVRTVSLSLREQCECDPNFGKLRRIG